jgi:autotransporter-associated beta strand protein
MPLAENAGAQTSYSGRSEAQNGRWDFNDNWWRGYTQAPQGNDIIRFDNGFRLTMTNDLQNTSRYRIFFDSGSGARTIGGTTANSFFDFGGNTPLIQNDSGNEQTINFKVINGNDVGFLDFIANSGNLVFGGEVSASGAGTRQLTVKGATNTTISGKVTQESGATFSLRKEGNGTLTLSGANGNDYTGATTVVGGTLKLDKSLGNAIVGNVTVAGGTLLLARSHQVDNGDGDTVTLSGGTIQRANGASEIFGALNLDQASTLNFGTATDNPAGNLTFGTYEGGSTPTHKLTVNNFFAGNTLVFGSDLSSSIPVGTYSGTTYTSSDNLFTINSTSGGFTTSLSGSTFTITAIPEPSTYVAAAGLLAMFLWPVRRRMIKDLKSILGLRPTGRERIEAYRKA